MRTGRAARRPRRRSLSRLAPLAALAALVLDVACSSESSLVGEGACDGYCFKIVGAKCKDSPTREQCLDECIFHQGDCAREWNDWARCTVIDATIACDSVTAQPKVVGCDTFQAAVAGACVHPYEPDAGSFDAR